MVGVILAAGNGVRLRTSTGGDGCKALRKINDTYLIELALNNFVDLELDKVIIVVGQQGEMIKNAMGYEYKGIKISYSYQAQQKGLINAFVQALDSIDEGEDVVLQLVDEILVDLKADSIKALAKEMAFDFYCGITYENNPEKIKNNFSVETDGDLIIEKCTEKPSVVVNNIKGTGFCIFRHNAVQILKSIYNEAENTPNELCDFLNFLISENKKGMAFCLAEREFNINTASDLSEAENYFN